jgi:hypothetical protein
VRRRPSIRSTGVARGPEAEGVASRAQAGTPAALRLKTMRHSILAIQGGGHFMKAALFVLLACGALAAAGPAPADPVRLDVIWARSTNGAPITLDGVLDEPAWAAAESKVVRYGRVIENGVPGSGSKEEGGLLTKDSTVATIKFLTVGNQLYMSAVVSDSSVGGGREFNRFDGFLMSIKDHTSLGRPAPPAEYLYSFWYQDSANGNPQPGFGAIGKQPGFGGRWANAPWGSPRTPVQIAAWDAVTRVRGQSNADTLPNGTSVADTGYVVEMRFDLSVMGYDVTQPTGDIIEFNLSIYDCDWFWWKNLFRMASNRAWWQSPWGNAMWYNEVRIHAKPSVTIASGAAPVIGAEYRVPNGASQPTPTINGSLSDAVWAMVPPLDIRWDDAGLRNSYGNPLKWRAGQFQPAVNGGTAPVVNPADATVKMFFKGNFLYLGFDVRDEVVQHHTVIDRYDGFIVTINDKTAKYKDRNLESRRLGFHIGPGGAVIADDYLPFLRDTVFGAQLGLQLKPNTTVDTTGNDFDEGYTAELSVDLTKIGYPSGLGDGALWIGIDHLDGDSYTPFTDSYGTRTWWGREYEHECCPAAAYMDPSLTLPLAVGDGPFAARFELLGSRPNPFTRSTAISLSLPRASRVTFEVFDLQGRMVNRRDLGVLEPGVRSVKFEARPGLSSGVYLYRLVMHDPTSGGREADLAGKMMFLE